MDCVGVICELDPLHRGHEYLLRRAAEETGLPVVCVLSGNFVQRGGVACLGKLPRAEMAVRCGADLVLELPTPWAMAPAEAFAAGGISLLSMAGAARLYFGSECGNTALLQQAADALLQEDVHLAIRAELAGGLSYAAARQRALEQTIGPSGALLANPNNTLAVEYLKAIRRQNLSLRPTAVLRQGAGHDQTPTGGFASASHLRRLLSAGQTEEALSLMPPAAATVLQREIDAGRAPTCAAPLESAILSRLRMLPEEAFLPYDGGGEGLYHRVYRAVRFTVSVEDLITSVATRRYPAARVRRLIWSAFLALEPPVENIPYLRVLAATARGRSLLRGLQDAGAPVLTKPADVRRLSPAAQALFAWEAQRTDLYALTYPDRAQALCGSDWRTTPVML